MIGFETDSRAIMKQSKMKYSPLIVNLLKLSVQTNTHIAFTYE